MSPLDERQRQRTFYPHTSNPADFTSLFGDVWRRRGDLLGCELMVTACPYTADEIATLHALGCRVGFLPPELSTQSARHLLGHLFPNMSSFSLHPDNVVTNDANPSGWFDYDAGLSCPYLETNEQQLQAAIAADDRELLTLNQYIVASQDSRLFTGRYLDD